MISEELQDQAALYTLGTLDTSEAAAFELELRANSELRELVQDLRETVGALAYSASPVDPPADLKQRVLNQIASEKVARLTRASKPAWLPWAIAALLLLGCGWLYFNQQQLQRELAQERASSRVTQATVVALAPTPNGTAKSKAVVAWDAERQSGVIKITGLPTLSANKDYQLWAVDADHKDPVSAGVVRVDADGIARVEFRPVSTTLHVKAFAISVERAGGAEKKEGPIVLLGSV